MFLLSFAPTRCKTNKFVGGYRALFIGRNCHREAEKCWNWYGNNLKNAGKVLSLKCKA